MPTGIAWTDESWNPVVGCSRVSTGCERCYAERAAHRLATMPQSRERYAGTTTMGALGIRWTGKVNLVPQVLDRPLRWRKPRLIFVNSMSDLFHESIPDDYIDEVFDVMAKAQNHIFQVLTKRPARMLAWFEGLHHRRPIPGMGVSTGGPPFCLTRYDIAAGRDQCPDHDPDVGFCGSPWPLPNVHLYVSTENQKTFDERVPILLQCPAVIHGISAEPLLGPIVIPQQNPDGHWPPNAPQPERPALAHQDWPDDFDYWSVKGAGLNHVIIGGESGQGARLCNRAWIRALVDQCQSAAVPVFVKQMGGNCYDSTRPREALESQEIYHKHTKGGDMDEWPAELRVREPARARTE